MFTKAAIVSALAGLAVAAPTPSAPNPNVFSVILNHSTAPIHLAGVSAKGYNFNVNNGTGTYCPSGTIDCSLAGEVTVFAYNPDSQTLSLDVVVPGGQQAFVRADGSLGFTIPHSAAIPEGASIGPFQFTPQETDGTVGQLMFETQGFNACKTGETGPTGFDVYQLYAAAVESEAQLEKECIDVGFLTSTWTGPIAYEYA
ncbi:hypothetical protein BKA65DRAFT_551893 [Rhexocercosporidium sp. MPI-PUGE-AT-0058]|nr:hypothetical protein BKA65DRAFT_551893 [Rhexocercosporidium sp. MPI-PUGE-AT-0058]